MYLEDIFVILCGLTKLKFKLEMVCNFYSNTDWRAKYFFHFKKLEIFFCWNHISFGLHIVPPYVWWRFYWETQTQKEVFYLHFSKASTILLSPHLTKEHRTTHTHIFNLRFSRKCFLKFMTSLSGLNDKDLKNGKKKFKGHIHT